MSNDNTVTGTNMRDSSREVNRDTIEGLISDMNSVDMQNTKDQQAIVSRIEETIDILNGDLSSISRQITQRETGRELSEKLCEEFDIDAHSEWLSKIRKAVSRKKDQVRTLERVLGEFRAKKIDKRFLFVDKIYNIAAAASELVDDLDDAKQDLKFKSYNQLRESIDSMDAIWEDWC